MDRAPSRRDWWLASLAPFLGLLLFRPWVRQAFPVWDYPDVLGILRNNPGVFDGAGAIAVWNRPAGRATYLSYLHYSTTWSLVGADAVGWQIARAIIMLTTGVLLVWVARRLGATPVAAAVAAGVWAVAATSTEGWLLLAGEQIGTLFLLLTALVAAGYTTSPAWKLRGVLMAVLCACVMFAKETVALCLPLVVLLAVCWDPEQGVRRPRFGPRERWLGALLLLVVALGVWQVGSAVSGAMSNSYASAFGREGLDGNRAVILFQAMFLPARFASAGIGTTFYPANLAFLLLVALGLLMAARDQVAPTGWGWLVAGLLLFPIIGALVYALWPRYTSYYGIPFFTGSALLLALVATRVERRGISGRVIVAVLGVIAMLFTGLASARTVRHRNATASLAARITGELSGNPRLDTLLVVTPRQGGRRWPVNASELTSYAMFMGIPDSMIPVMRDASCEEIVSRLQRPLGRSAVLNDQNPCGRLPGQTRTWEEDLNYLDWTSWRRIPLSMRVDLLAPSWAPGDRRPDPT